MKRLPQQCAQFVNSNGLMSAFTQTATTANTGSTIMWWDTALSTNTTYLINAHNLQNQTLYYRGQPVVLDDGDQADGVRYKKPPAREFNPFVNASDLVADFIKDIGQLGVPHNKALGVPVELFVNWLIHKAARQDGDEVPEDVPRLEAHPSLLKAKAS